MLTGFNVNCWTSVSRRNHHNTKPNTHPFNYRISAIMTQRNRRTLVVKQVTSSSPSRPTVSDINICHILCLESRISRVLSGFSWYTIYIWLIFVQKFCWNELFTLYLFIWTILPSICLLPYCAYIYLDIYYNWAYTYTFLLCSDSSERKL